MRSEKMQFYLPAVLLCALGAGMDCSAAQGAAAAEGGFLAAAWDRLAGIAGAGEPDILLSGYAHHGRDTYTARRRAKLNEQAWGGGFGKTLRNENGNDESIYVSAIRDSNKNIQWSAGYAYQWMFPVAGSRFEAGAGLTAVIISRQDWFGGAPFPAVLPVFSLGVKQFRLNAIYVPHVSTKKGKGDIVLLFAKLSF